MLEYEELYEELGLDTEELNYDELLSAYIWGLDCFLYTEIDSSLYHETSFLHGVIFGFQFFISRFIKVQPVLLSSLLEALTNKYFFYQELFRKNTDANICREAEVVCMTFEIIKFISEMGDFEGSDNLISGLLLNFGIINKQMDRKNRGKEYGMEYYRHHN